MSRIRQMPRLDLLPPEPDDCDPESDEPAEPSDLDYEDIPCTDDDDRRWDAFIPDDDEHDPEPDPGDFWVENCELEKLLVSPSPCLLV